MSISILEKWPLHQDTGQLTNLTKIETKQSLNDCNRQLLSFYEREILCAKIDGPALKWQEMEHLVFTQFHSTWFLPKWHTYQITLRWQYAIWSAFGRQKVTPRTSERGKHDQSKWNLHWNSLTPSKLLWQNIVFEEKKPHNWNNMNKQQPLLRAKKNRSPKELTRWKWHNENSGSCKSNHQCVCLLASFSFHFIELSGCAYNLCAVCALLLGHRRNKLWQWQWIWECFSGQFFFSSFRLFFHSFTFSDSVNELCWLTKWAILVKAKKTHEVSENKAKEMAWKKWALKKN